MPWILRTFFICLFDGSLVFFFLVKGFGGSLCILPMYTRVTLFCMNKSLTYEKLFLRKAETYELISGGDIH